jgi:hypothetical protein
MITISAQELSVLVTRTIAAPPATLYGMVSDLPRMGEWSPTCTGCRWDDDARAAAVGAWFTGSNSSGGRQWETRSEIVAAEEGQRFEFVVGGADEGWVRWSYSFVPHLTGTEVTEVWQVVRLVPHMGGNDDELVALKERTLASIVTTLDNLKIAAEATNAPD